MPNTTETFGPIKLVSSPDKPEFAMIQYPPDRIANEDLKNTFLQQLEGICRHDARTLLVFAINPSAKPKFAAIQCC